MHTKKMTTKKPESKNYGCVWMGKQVVLNHFDLDRKELYK